jgi:acyl dehydratase
MALATQQGLWFEDFEIGLSGVSASRTMTEADIVNFAGLSGDFNDIHVDAEAAKNSVFGQRVAHGLLGLSIVSGLVVQMGFMKGTVDAFRSVEWEFTGPVFIGDTIHAEVEVTELKPFPRLKNGRVTAKINVKKQDGSVVQRGTWSLLVKSRPKTE